MDCYLECDGQGQTLTLFVHDKIHRVYPVSTGKAGFGEAWNSGCTPRGWHQIRAKIGAGCPPNTVFVARRPTGELYTPALAEKYPERDWILTRILWLTGLEAGKNRYGQLDTGRRKIYLHGTPDTQPLGAPDSHGCLRMRNADILELFEIIPSQAKINIIA